MVDLWKLIGYVAVWLVATRLIYSMMRGPHGEHPGLFVPAFLGVFWPVILGACVVAAPFAMVGWLASLGIKHGGD